MSKYLPSLLWTVISARGLYKWRKNAQQMSKNIVSLRAHGKDDPYSEAWDPDAVMFAKADEIMDNLRAFAFLNGLVIGLLSFLVVYGFPFTRSPVFLRIYSDYTLTVLIGAFFIFMLNGEIYGWVLNKVLGRR